MKARWQAHLIPWRVNYFATVLVAASNPLVAISVDGPNVERRASIQNTDVKGLWEVHPVTWSCQVLYSLH